MVKREIVERCDSLFDVGRSMFDVRVVGFGVQAVKVLLTAFSLSNLSSERSDLIIRCSMFDVRCSTFSLFIVIGYWGKGNLDEAIVYLYGGDTSYGIFLVGGQFNPDG
jgi:hypothetical protein